MDRPKKILVIDDSREIRLLLRIRLEMEGFTVFEAEDGKAGVDAAKRHLPDMIITDFLMPEMNGLEAARILKLLPETRSIPIIMLTSLPLGRSLIDELCGIGIDVYMMKPYEFEFLFEKINELFESQIDGQLELLNEELDRRRFLRYETFHYAQVEVKGEKYQARIKNISKNGINLVLPLEAEVGSFIKILFQNNAMQCESRAKVVWVQPEKVFEKVSTGLEIHSIVCPN